jgi:hypothetical protein
MRTTSWMTPIAALCLASCATLRVDVVASGSSVHAAGADWQREAGRALLERAATDLSCAASEIHIAQGTVGWFNSVRLEGCGRGETYYLTMTVGRTSAVPEYAGREVVATVNAWVRLSEPSADVASALLRTFTAAGFTDPSAWDWTIQEARFMTQLTAQGAHDLQCALRDVYARRGNGRSIPPMAEGCGRRAVYVTNGMGDYTLTSIVPVQ